MAVPNPHPLPQLSRNVPWGLVAWFIQGQTQNDRSLVLCPFELFRGGCKISLSPSPWSCNDPFRTLDNPMDLGRFRSHNQSMRPSLPIADCVPHPWTIAKYRDVRDLDDANWGREHTALALSLFTVTKSSPPCSSKSMFVLSSCLCSVCVVREALPLALDSLTN